MTHPQEPRVGELDAKALNAATATWPKLWEEYSPGKAVECAIRAYLAALPVGELVGRAERELSRVLEGFEYVMPADGMSRVLAAASPLPPPVGDAGLVERLLEAANDERDHAQEQDFWHEDLLREAATALSVRPAGEAVKALEWNRRNLDGTIHIATSLPGEYWAWELAGFGYWSWGSLSGREVYGGLEAAKAAAQQDYETRIRSALIPAPPVQPQAEQDDPDEERGKPGDPVFPDDPEWGSREHREAREQAEQADLVEAAKRLLAVIDMAGLLNLSNGVQLGQTSWFVKASDACEWLRATLQKREG